MRIDWVHPSWRDLVIDHLSRDGTARQRFLSRCGVNGAALALSVAGGRDGRRQLPLMIDDADWDALTDRIYVLAGDLDAPDLATLLSSIHDAVRRTHRGRARTELLALARSVLERLVAIWDGATLPVPLSPLGGWFALAAVLPSDRARPSLPDLTRTWAELYPAVAPDLTDRASTERFTDWLALADLLREYEPAELERLHFDETYETVDDFITDVERRRDTIHPAARGLVISGLRRIHDLNPSFEGRAAYAVIRLEEANREQAGAAGYGDPAPGREPIGWQRFDVRRVLKDL